MADSIQHVEEQLSDVIRLVRGQVAAFEAEAHAILGKHEAASKSRVISLDQSRRKLLALSVQQEELLQESLECIVNGLFRAAHVAAWQAFIDSLEEKLASDGLVKVHAKRPNWVKHATMDELRESISEYQIIEVAREVGLLSKSAMKSLHGLLSTRNDCAHPSLYRPGLNQSLGYVSELIDRIAYLQSQTF